MSDETRHSLASPEPIDRPADEPATTEIVIEPSPEGGEPTTRRISGRKLALIAGGGVATVAVLYGAAYAAVGGEVPSDTTVLGVEIGGMSQSEAEAALTGGLAERVATPIALSPSEGEEPVPLDPATSGLGVDAAATVDQVDGGASPADLWRGLFGGGEVEPVYSVDKDQLAASLQQVAGTVNREPVDGGVTFDAGQAVAVPAQLGRTLDVQSAADAIGDSFLRTTDPVALPFEETTPTIDQADVDKAMAEFAQPAMSGPVTVVAGNQQAVLNPTLLGSVLIMSSTPEGTLAPQLDGERLLTEGEEALGSIESGAKDASVRIENGAPVVVPGQAGQGVSAPDLAAAVLAALPLSGDQRVANVALSTVEPEITTEEAANLGVASVISETTTRFPHSDYRNVNIRLAAEKIDNTFIAPGETFSLNGIVGERTAATGFVPGWTIQGGVFKKDYGGGVSQATTTVFNAAYKAGMEDIEHKPHSLYFSRYPLGVEATVNWGSLDMRWKNDTPYGVVVDTSFSPSSSGSQGSITVRIWSTKYWDTNISVSDRYAHKTYGTRYDTSPNCEAQAGQDGFQVDVTRNRTSPQGETVTDKDHVVYNAGTHIICGPAPA